MFSWIHLPLTRRLAITVYTLCLAGLISAYFLVSTMYVQHSAYIQGTSRLVQGAPNALRGALMNAQTGQRLGRTGPLTLRLLTEAEAKNLPAEPTAPTNLGVRLDTPEVGPGALFHATVTPPADLPPGPYVLLFEAQIPGRGDVYTARASVEIVAPTSTSAAWPALTTRREESQRRERYGSLSATGPIHIDLLTHRPELSRGLPDTVFLRTYDAQTGAPVSCDISFDEVRGLTDGAPLPTTLRTNTLGLARLRFAPLVAHTWTLSTECDRPTKSEATVSVSSVPSQSSMRVRDPITTFTDAQGSLQSLFDSGGMLLDLYHQGRWVKAATFGLRPGRSGWSVPLESLDGEQLRFYRVQVYQEFFGAGNAWDARWVIAASPTHPRPQRAALDALLARHLAARPGDLYFNALSKDRARLETLTDAQVRALTGALLEAAPSHFSAPETLINSGLQDEQALEAWKQGVRGTLISAISWAMTIGVAVLLLIVLRGIQEAGRRRQLLAEVDLELLNEDDEPDFAQLARTERAARLARAVAIVQGVVVLGTIVFTAGTLLMMLRLL